MDIRRKYRDLGWQHDLWEYVRLFRSLRGNAGPALRASMLRTNRLDITLGFQLTLPAELSTLIDDYLTDAESDTRTAFAALRTEQEAIADCTALATEVRTTTTRNQDHHQSAKALVAQVSELARLEARRARADVETDPQRRAVWTSPRGFHVSARNLDGALPSLQNPVAIWEIKEYWGTTKGGSKMSDAVYECQLVGSELRDFTARTGVEVLHAVFLDGKAQWSARRSDLVRFIDLFHQGIIDNLIVGKQTNTEWPVVLRALLQPPAK